MPEGHTLHRLAAQFDAVFVGRPWRVSSPQGRFAAGAALLDGRTPSGAEAWGKHLFVSVDEHIWQIHLGLYGAFSFAGSGAYLEALGGAASTGAPRSSTGPSEVSRSASGAVVPAEPVGAVRARLVVPEGWADLRGPSLCRVLTTAEHQDVCSRLGPDPLRRADPPGQSVGDSEAVEEFARRLSTRRIPVAQALLDQQVIAGVGNIYRAESLFLEGIDPLLPARSLSDERTGHLWRRLGRQLRDGVAEGVIRTLRPEQGAAADADRRHWVYRHAGTACLRCGTPIARRELAGRTLYWCPGCQTG